MYNIFMRIDNFQNAEKEGSDTFLDMKDKLIQNKIKVKEVNIVS